MKTRPELHSLLYNALPNINEVAPLSTSERQCLTEVREVLEKHACLHRFGINLLHNHFDLAEDEILVETTDVRNRTLTAAPRRRSEVVLENLVETQWRWDKSFTNGCEKFCPTDEKGRHAGWKDHVSDDDDDDDDDKK